VHPIVVVNDTLQHAHGHLEVRRAGLAVKLLDLPFEVEANGKAPIGQLPHPSQAEMWQLNWSTDSNSSWTSHYLAVSGPINLRQYKEWMKLIGL
jgi:hypothetical protein